MKMCRGRIYSAVGTGRAPQAADSSGSHRVRHVTCHLLPRRIRMVTKQLPFSFVTFSFSYAFVMDDRFSLPPPTPCSTTLSACFTLYNGGMCLYLLWPYANSSHTSVLHFSFVSSDSDLTYTLDYNPASFMEPTLLRETFSTEFQTVQMVLEMI